MATSDISIIARDEASRTMQAVADAVQRLNVHIVDLANSSESLKTAQKNADGFFSSLKVAAGAALAYLGSTKLLAFSETAIEAYNKQNRAARSLGEAQISLAADMQKALGVGDEVTLGIMRQASLLGVADRDLQSVSMATLGLAEATGQGLNESLKKVNAAINGNANALVDYMPELRNMTSEEAKLAAVTELAEAGLRKKANSMNYLDGSMKSASNAVGDLWEKIGILLVPGAELAASTITTLASVATSALIPAVEAMGATMEWWANATETATSYAIGAITAVEVAFTNWSTIVDIAGSTAYLAMLKFSLDVEYLLTDKVPAYIAWFAENWVAVFRDMGVAVVTIFQNIGQNIGEAAFALFDWISSGFSGGFEGLSERLGNAIFVGMMDGFEAKAKALPQILARSITDDETMLANRIGALGNSLGGQFNKKFQDRMEAFKLNKAAFNLDIDLASVGAKPTGGAASELKAIESRLLTRGRADDPNAKIVDNTQATVKELQRLNQREEAKAGNKQQNIVLGVAKA